MASSKEYLHFILEQLSGLEGIAYKAMMGEFIIYYKGKIVGGIYDDRLLVKAVNSAIELCQMLNLQFRMRGQKKCCWLMMLTIGIIWLGYFWLCMMNCQQQSQKERIDLD